MNPYFWERVMEEKTREAALRSATRRADHDLFALTWLAEGLLGRLKPGVPLLLAGGGNG